MRTTLKSWPLLAAAVLCVGMGSPASADGDVKCNAGPQEKWQKISKLKKQVW